MRAYAPTRNLDASSSRRIGGLAAHREGRPGGKRVPARPLHPGASGRRLRQLAPTPNDGSARRRDLGGSGRGCTNSPFAHRSSRHRLASDVRGGRLQQGCRTASTPRAVVGPLGASRLGVGNVSASASAHRNRVEHGRCPAVAPFARKALTQPKAVTRRERAGLRVLRMRRKRHDWQPIRTRRARPREAL